MNHQLSIRPVAKCFGRFSWHILPAVLLTISPVVAAGEITVSHKASELYTQGPGEDPSFQELIDKGVIVKGSGNGKPIPGTKIDVNNRLLESNLHDLKGTVQPDRIHTHVNSNIHPKQFDQWSRWYQEDGNTQIFRLFKGEQSVRSLNNIKAGRIEAVKTFNLPKSGGWVEWQGTYTIIKPGGGCIFQLMVEKDPKTGAGGLWAVHIDQTAAGDIVMLRRRPKAGEEKKVLIAKDAVGKNVTVKVRYDGNGYEVSRKIEGQDGDFVFVGKGTYPPTQQGKVAFRWGIYQGSKPGSSIAQDCMLFVTGVKLTRSAAHSSPVTQ